MTPVATSKPSAQAAEVMRRQQGLNRYAAIALTTASFFLIVMAILVNSPPLFYMATAIVTTLLGARLQAYLAVRGLRIERSLTPAVQAGQTVTVHLTVWSEKRLKRPLLTVIDHFPRRIGAQNETPSVPVAPSFDQPIQTKYSFKPTRRGRYSWSQITVVGSDALGLVTQGRTYAIDPTELTVYPSALPVNIHFTPGGGWGQSELESGRSTGSGLEPRGIRGYAYGDPIKTVHWPSTARTGKMMVKEFESGTGLSMRMALQRTLGTDFGEGEMSTFEAMCSNALFLASMYVKKGATVVLPQMEPLDAGRNHPEARERQIREALTDIQPDRPDPISVEVSRLASNMQPGESLVILMSTQDPSLPGVLFSLADIQKVCLLYNPFDYLEAGERTARPISPASDPSYIRELERAGATALVMPRAERIG
jgi:uncharacterized protein (DUF58 family)